MQRQELVGELLQAKATIAGLLISLVGILFLFISTYDIYREVTFSLAMVFIPSGIISVIIDFSLKKDFFRQMELMLNASDRKTDKLQECGVVDVCEGLSFDEISEGIRNAKKEIHILHTWLPNFVAIESALKSAIKNNCSVKILIMDEKSVHVTERTNDLGASEGFALSQLRSSISELSQFYYQSDFPEKFEVRRYTSTPVLSLYKYDDVYNIGFFWQSKSSLTGMQLKLANDDAIFCSSVAEHFNKIWDGAESHVFRKNG